MVRSSVGVLGAGRIGSAIIKALKTCMPEVKIYASGRRDETLQKASELGALVSRDNAYVVSNSELVVISVKPYHFPELYNQVLRELWSGKVVVSIMAGVKLSTLSKVLESAEIFRAMPNINALVGRSTTAIATNDDVSTSGRTVVEEVFQCLGSVYWVPEEYLDAWTGLVGSGPAFMAEIIDGLVLGAVASGMSRDIAYRAVLDMIEGTIKLLKELKTHPIEIRDEVTTPAGTTIRGLKILEDRGIKAGLMEVVETSYMRSAKIGEEIDKDIKTRIRWK
ncbi:MAG: pyrroline-5-carboxylate reductase [Desulfurococcaceae archaeon TW002]